MLAKQTTSGLSLAKHVRRNPSNIVQTCFSVSGCFGVWLWKSVHDLGFISCAWSIKQNKNTCPIQRRLSRKSFWKPQPCVQLCNAYYLIMANMRTLCTEQYTEYKNQCKESHPLFKPIIKYDADTMWNLWPSLRFPPWRIGFSRTTYCSGWLTVTSHSSAGFWRKCLIGRQLPDYIITLSRNVL